MKKNRQREGIKLISAIQAEIKKEKELKNENTCSETNCSTYCSDHHDNN